MSYHVMVLPDRGDISPEVLIKIEDLVKSGATIVGPKPVRSNSLKNYPECDTQIKDLAEKIWGDCDGKSIKQHNYGKGRVIWNIPLNEVLAGMDVIPDFQVVNTNNQDKHIDYIHRITDREDIYFISNSLDDWQDINCTFRVAGKKIPYLWDADDGSIQKVPIYQVDSGTITLNLKMAPFGSVFVVFQKSEDSDHHKEMAAKSNRAVNHLTADDKEIPASDALTPLIYPDKLWSINFPQGWGAPDSIYLNNLVDWTKSDEPGIKYFSGTARYKNQFTIPDALIQRKYSLLLDIGDVREVAEIFINGQAQTILWKKPFCVEISASVRPGSNTLEIDVTNLWNNRIVGDLRSDGAHAYTATNIKYKFKKESPLISSGLLGPVVIRPVMNVASETDK